MPNQLIKRAFSECEYTPDLIQELTKCAKDPIFFIKNYIKIQHPTKGNVPFLLFEFQEELIKTIQENRWVVALLSRQTGKTTTISMYLLWFAMFKPDQTILIASKNNGHAIEIMDRIRFAYEELPHWLKAGCKYYNKHSIEFDNGSKIKSEATTEKTGRGLSISLLYLDELAFINPNIQEKMWTSLAPTLSTGGAAIISSTPNGDTELFSQIWRGANAGLNNFVPIFIPWNRHPERDENYLAEMRKQLITENKFRQEILCEFISSDALLIDGIKMAYVTPQQPISEHMGFKFWTDQIGGQNKTYLIGIDPATGNGNDYTVIEVVEFPTLIQIAELRLNSVNIPLIYSKIKWLLGHLRQRGSDGKRAEILWSFERNGVGEALVAMIQNDDDKSGGVYIDGAELYNENPSRLGVYTTGKSKFTACLQLKNLLEKTTNKLEIKSSLFLFEIKNYIAAGGTYSARSGATDDAISAMLVIMKLLSRLSSYDDKARKLVYENIAPDADLIPDSCGDEPVPFSVL